MAAMLLWKRYVNNKMAAMRFLHLQQYSHRLTLLYVFLLTVFVLRVLLYLMCICCTMYILLFLLWMPDSWLEVSIRKVL